MNEVIVDAEAELDAAAKRPGYARIIVPEAATAISDPKFRLSRLDREHESQLGPNGWQNGLIDLSPWKAEVDRGSLILYIGPDVVDNIPNHINIEVSIPAARVIGEIFWPDIPPSNVARDQRTDGSHYRSAAPPPPEAGPSTPQEARPVGTSEPETKSEPDQPQDIPKPTDEPTDGRNSEEALRPSPEPEIPSRRDRYKWFAVGIVILLAAGALGFLLYERWIGPQPEPVPVPALAGPSCSQPYDYVRAFVEGHPAAPQAWFDEATRLLSDDCRDAATLLLLEATDADPPSVAALIFAAKLADPLVETDDRILFTAPDPRSALSYYGLAAQNGSSEAGAARQALIRHLEEKAMNGDQEAQNTLDSVQ